MLSHVRRTFHYLSWCPLLVVLTDFIGYPAYTSSAPGLPGASLAFIQRQPPSRGALVALTSPLDPSRTLYTRIVAVGGDYVRVASHPSDRRVHAVPIGALWVEGEGDDSDRFGAVSEGLVRGRVKYVLSSAGLSEVIEEGVSDRVIASRTLR